MNAHVIASGRVQGVGFRFFALQQAEQYSITGWVKNKSDGTVELEVEGDDNQVNAYLNDLENEHNPPINIKNMQVDKQQNEKGYSDFSIK